MIKLKNLYPRLWKHRPWALRLAIAFIVYSLIGFLIVPALIKWQLVKQLPQLTKRTAAVRQVRFNPWTLSLTIRDLTLKEPDGQLFASWAEFYANFQLSSLFRWAWTFKEIHLTEPHGILILQRDGRLNVANIVEHKDSPAPPPKTASPLPRMNVFLLAITNGFVSIEDQTRHSPFRTEYRPINLLLKDLTTRPGKGTPYSFRAESDTQKTLAWTGDVTLQPLSSHGTLEIQNAEPKKYQPYLEDFARAQIADGRVNIKGDYFFAFGTNGMDLSITNGIFQLTSLKVVDPSASETVLSLPNLALQGMRFNLRERQAGAEKLRLEGLEILSRINKDGSINLLGLLVPRTNSVAKTNGPAPWTIGLAEFQLASASVQFQDKSRTRPFETRLQPIDITLSGFTTRSNIDATYQYSITTETAEKMAGQGTMSIHPLRSGGELSLTAVDIKKYSPYFENLLRGEVLSGKVDFRTTYQAARTAAATNALTGSVSNLLVRIADLRLKSPAGSEPVVSIPELAVEGAEANLQTQTATVSRIQTTGGAILARRETNGTINLLDLLNTSARPAAESNSLSQASVPWKARIDQVVLTNYTINLEDQIPTRPALVKLDQITLRLDGISTEPQAELTNVLALRVNESGWIKAEGTVTLAPLSLAQKLSITNLDLRAVQPYLEPFAKIELTGGSFQLAGDAKWAAANSGRLQVAGGFSISNFSISDPVSEGKLINWTNLAVDGISFASPQPKLEIQTIQWEGLNAEININSNKQLNVLTVLVKSTNAPAARSTNEIPMPIAINLIALTNSSIHFADGSIQPRAAIDLEHLGGTVRGLSSDAKASAEVDISGTVGEASPFFVFGRINPLAAEPRLDLTISNRNMQLSPFTPYMEKFAGHPLNKGRLSMALHYTIDGKDLQAQNHVQVEQLSLGPRNDSPDATKLPVKLAVALLKDSSGRILLDVPLGGHLDDPQFRIGPIVLKVIVNLITKAVASPFKLLGAAVGGGEELSYLEFVPGTADFAEGETNKIRKLVQALSERALNLDIEASVDPERDRNALARRIVQEEIRSARLQELALVGQTLSDTNHVEIEPGEQARLLRAKVYAMFGTNITAAVQEFLATQTNATAIAGITSESAEKPRPEKWYRKLLIPFQKKDSPEAVARRQAKADELLLEQNPALGSLSIATMEALLVHKTEVPPDHFLKLQKDRADAVRNELLGAQLSEDRILLIAPKPLKEGYRGEARVNLSLN